MQESTEHPVTKPVAGEAHCDSANTARSENQTSAPQNSDPANFVEIYWISKPDSPDKEEPTAEEMEEKTCETDAKTVSPGEQQITREVTPHQQEQEPRKKEPLASELVYAELRNAFNRRDMSRASELSFEYSRLCAQERAAEKLAQEQQRATYEDSVDEEDEDEEEFAKAEQPQPEPDQFVIEIGGNPAKTAGLEMEDLIRPDDGIVAAQYSSAEDGIINQLSGRFQVPWGLKFLYESLILPAGVEGFSTTRELFNDISALLHQQVTLPSKDCSLLACWAIATWFTEHLAFVPTVVISGPASIADVLLRTLVAVCRRPLLLGELSASVLRKLPIYPILPTLLVRESQLNRQMYALLDASNQPGYLFFSSKSGKTFQQLYCPKCIYVGECVKDATAASNSIHINLSGSALQPGHSLPTKDEITSFQNRLFSYRLLNHEKVASANHRVSGFRPEMNAVADVLAAAIVNDLELQRGIIEALKVRDEEARVDRATGLNGLIVQAVLFHCHQKDQQKFVREIAATTNRLYAEDGESLKVSNERVGHVLKHLGLYSRRLGNAGRGLLFDQATQAHAHRLGQGYDVLTVEPTCKYCHELQQSQSEEVVQVV